MFWEVPTALVEETRQVVVEATRISLPIDRRPGPAVGTSAGDFAVGQGLLELGNAGVGDPAVPN